MKTVVFISTPMSGLTDEEILKNIEEAKAVYLKKTGKDIREVAFVNNLERGKTALDFEKKLAETSGAEFIEPMRMSVWYLGIALCNLADCDEAVFYPENWTRARGCQVEHDVCVHYVIPFYVADGDEIVEVLSMKQARQKEVKNGQ